MNRKIKNKKQRQNLIKSYFRNIFDNKLFPYKIIVSLFTVSIASSPSVYEENISEMNKMAKSSPMDTSFGLENSWNENIVYNSFTKKI